MKKVCFVVLLILTLSSCMDIFTTSVLSSLKTDVSDMSSSELSEYLETTPLSDISDEDLLSIESSLSDSRLVLTDEDLEDEELKSQYLEETKTLLDINMAQSDVEGLISDVLGTVEDGEEDEDFIDTLLDDTERLDNLAEAADYAVDAFLVDSSSLTSTELVVGSVGLLSDILQDDESYSALESVEDYETDTLITAGFTTDEISDIQTANKMLDLAESNSGEDSVLADLFEGMPI